MRCKFTFSIISLDIQVWDSSFELLRLIISYFGKDAFKYLWSSFDKLYLPFLILSYVSIDGTAVIKLIGMFSKDALEIALWLVALLTLLQVLFGDSFVQLFAIDILSNIGGLMSQFGSEGLVGLIAAGLVAYLIVRK
mgnify:CR=1 FL=1